MRTAVSKEKLKTLVERIQALYLSDQIPWVVGYSGGKDSTAALQLVWSALMGLSPNERKHKPVHVISTDTLVEQPVVASWVTASHELMRKAAEDQGMPIRAHRLTPLLDETYWVNLIGRGYSAPRLTFRWCTSRLKIDPSNRFILDMVRSHGETILVLGTRKAESSRRAANMARHEQRRAREMLSPNASLANSWVLTPLEDWSNDDVWIYLMQFENPWGQSNRDLLTMYRGASPDNECPLVLDTATPSCGNSRFGCWVCTLVSADKSMEAMVQNDLEKEWMAPLLRFRNWLASMDEHGRINDRDRRDFRRMDGSITLKNGRAVHGPYTRHWRHEFLRRLVELQEEVQRTQPKEMQPITLVSDAELREIRRIWLVEKHEFEDALPSIYFEALGRHFADPGPHPPLPFGRREWAILESLCGQDALHMEMVASLIDLQQRAAEAGRGKDMPSEFERTIRRCFYTGEEDAVAFQVQRQGLRGAAQLGFGYPQLEEGDLE